MHRLFFISAAACLALANLDLSRFDAAPITHLSYLSFEGQGAFPAEG